MPVGGYDPDDLDEKLESLMADRDPSNWLTDEEVREYERGGSLVELLDEDDIHDLLHPEESEQSRE